MGGQRGLIVKDYDFMGQMRFHVPQRERVPPHALDRAYLAGMEYIPWQSRSRWDGDEIIVDRDIDESGCLYIPWHVQGHGELVLSTTSLMERDAAYHLPVELARGAINRVRNQLAAWKPQGFAASAEFNKNLQAATQKFIQAATSQPDPVKAATEAEVAMVYALNAINILTHDFTAQVLAMRHQQAPKLATLLAGNVGCEPLAEHEAKGFLAAFNTAVAPLNWRDVELNEGEHSWDVADKQIEWCRANGLKICAGPLLRLYQGNLPDWLYLWEDDFDTIRSFALQYVQAVVQRYAGKVHIWHCAAGMNKTGALSLPEEFKLRLTVDAIQTISQANSRAPVIVSFDQPWAEYLKSEDLDLSPLHFADALARADLGVAGIGLEFNFGYWPGGTLTRDLLEVNRLIDYWSQLGLPLLIFLTIPSSDKTDPQAKRHVEPLPNAFPGGLGTKSQMEFAGKLIPLLLSKQCIHGVIWNQFSDAQPHEFPHGGVFDATRKPKPTLEVLAKLRQKHLT